MTSKNEKQIPRRYPLLGMTALRYRGKAVFANGAFPTLRKRREGWGPKSLQRDPSLTLFPPHHTQTRRALGTPALRMTVSLNGESSSCR
jgi:hypothetical protein